MKTSDEIVHSVANAIHNLYADPQHAVRDVGELDVALYQLHWQYANAVDRLEDFVRTRWNRFEQDPDGFLQTLAIKEAHLPVECSDAASQLIDEWKRLDADLGIPLP